MEIVVTYDVATETLAGRRRLRKVAEACQAYGQRVQFSVFECSLTNMQFEALRDRLRGIMDEQQDSLRIYRLPQPRKRFLWTYGVRREVDFKGPLVV